MIVQYIGSGVADVNQHDHFIHADSADQCRAHALVIRRAAGELIDTRICSCCRFDQQIRHLRLTHLRGAAFGQNRHKQLSSFVARNISGFCAAHAVTQHDESDFLPDINPKCILIIGADQTAVCFSVCFHRFTTHFRLFRSPLCAAAARRTHQYPVPACAAPSR